MLGCFIGFPPAIFTDRGFAALHDASIHFQAGELRETEGKPMSKGWGLKGMVR